MKKENRMFKVILWLFYGSAAALAQDWQNRDVVHLTAEGWKGYNFVAWSISNFKSDTPRNTNLFFGVGRGDKDNWLEAMAQKQWNQKGGFWALDIRSRVQLTKQLSVYAEPTAFVSQRGFYHFVIVEYRIWHKLAVGGEEESIHRPPDQPQQINFGPRISLGLGSGWGFDYGLALAYRVSLTGLNEFRVYGSVSRRFGLRRVRK